MTNNMSIGACCPLTRGDNKSKDLLGFAPSVRALQKIVNGFRPPFTLGIYGDWGSGKTSYMGMLFDALKANNKYTPIWFNAWKYESEESVILPLLSKMSEEFKDDKTANDKFSSIKKVATAVTFIGANLGLKIVTGNQVALKDVQTALKDAESHLPQVCDTWVNKCDELEIEFKELTDTLTDGGEKTIVVFVDGLDRCAPENVVKLLESVKNYLSVEGSHCLFIIGVDKTVITKGIIAKYGGSLIDGDEYLEKIISYSVDVPTPTVDCIDEYVLETARLQLKSDTFDTISKDIKILAKSLAGYGMLNPRKIKRVLPRLLFGLLQEDSKGFLIEGIAYLVLLREYYPDVYISKRNKRSINYSPTNAKASVSKDSFEGIEKMYGKGWAELIKGPIDTTYKLMSIRDCDCRHMLQSIGVASESFLNDLRKGISMPGGCNKARIVNFCDSGIEMSPDAYFVKVESLFVLN